MGQAVNIPGEYFHKSLSLMFARCVKLPSPVGLLWESRMLAGFISHSTISYQAKYPYWVMNALVAAQHTCTAARNAASTLIVTHTHTTGGAILEKEVFCVCVCVWCVCVCVCVRGHSCAVLFAIVWECIERMSAGFWWGTQNHNRFMHAMFKYARKQESHHSSHFRCKNRPQKTRRRMF